MDCLKLPSHHPSNYALTTFVMSLVLLIKSQIYKISILDKCVIYDVPICACRWWTTEKSWLHLILNHHYARYFSPFCAIITLYQLHYDERFSDTFCWKFFLSLLCYMSIKNINLLLNFRSIYIIHTSISFVSNKGVKQEFWSNCFFDNNLIPVNTINRSLFHFLGHILKRREK